MEMVGTCPSTTLYNSVNLWARRLSWRGGLEFQLLKHFGHTTRLSGAVVSGYEPCG
ncbi:hypothetical protein DPMN_029289 [Dreissena polymorpha]|uniref:Uncharacterized protein n=1 Tax=Dreissena polymorpha TaxID=45954 RepID=A0A9D4LXV6_DREPO|nr:hypothetical protein DPMN_029289 [Dreissena polymorpha]